MAKAHQHNGKRTAPGSDANNNEILRQTDARSAVQSEEIAQLAYSYWLARGCPDGSPDQDWLRAEEDLRNVNSKPL